VSVGEKYWHVYMSKKQQEGEHTNISGVLPEKTADSGITTGVLQISVSTETY
jgi:hypothetical protein